ncbi:MAG: TonB-dependent receptor [Mediterranea sp.]|nr:TonB-dependent receptor [Mediterranea sp.]
MLLCCGNAFAQNPITVKGIVVDAKSKEPLIGVSISDKSAQSGTVTGIDGRFTLTVASANTTLEFSYIGYSSRTLPASQANGTIQLSEDTGQLDEVVVVGYGTQKKANLTGSVSQLESKALADRPIQNVSSALQGLMPGVTVTAGQGRPGQDGGTIRVRGTGTFNTADPYVLIDGVESGTMNSLDPNDIESISVLKDAASAAIYGSKASNGVILITTKRGKSGKPRVSYTGYVGMQKATSTIDRLNSDEYAEMYNKALESDGKPARFSDDDIKLFRDGSDPYGHPNTNWYDLAYRTGVQTQHNVNISGGNEAVRYMASAGYLYQNGILKNTNRNQMNARTNLDITLSKRFTARMNLAFVNNDYEDANASYAGGSSDQIIRQLNIVAPWIPNRNADGSYGTVSDGNPIAWLDASQYVKRKNSNFTGMVALDWTILDGLVLTAQEAYTSNRQHFKDFRAFIQYNPNKASEPNSLDERVYLWDRNNFDLTLNYEKKWGLHQLKALGGWHTEKYNYTYTKMYRKNFPTNETTDIDAGDASTQKNEGYTRELAMVSFFGRVNYDYAGRYLFEGNVRGDASSRFAKGHRWGYFPSFSAGWRISEEAFMESAKGWLNNLKIRVSWGQLGNQDALSDYYPYLNTYNLDSSYPFGGALQSGYYQKYYRKEDISWEKSRTYGVGVDLAFLDRFNLSLDYYDRKTTGIIMDVGVPTEFGLEPYKDNVGSMVNRGFELNISYNDRWGDWSLQANANTAFNKNEVLDLGGVDYIVDKDDNNLRRAVGQQMNAYYMYKADGFFQSDAEAKAYMDKYAGNEGYPFGRPFKAGDIRYVDTNGDGKMDANDRVYCNSSMPKWTYGLNLTLGWKDFDLGMIWTGAAGASRVYNQEVFGDFRGDSSHPSTIWRDSWTYNPSNPKMPAIYNANYSNSAPQTVMSTFWLQNVNYIRLKNLQLGYTLPKNLVKRAGIERVRFYLSFENLLTFDSLPVNIDPETTSNRGSSYPLIKTHSLGVNITF